MSAADTYAMQGVFDSKNEYFLAKSFDILQVPYEPQKRILAPARMPGTIKIDFIVYNPFTLPVEVYGEYFHTGELGADDWVREGRIYAYYRMKVYRVWGTESDTLEHAMQAARRIKSGDTVSG